MLTRVKSEHSLCDCPRCGWPDCCGREIDLALRPSGRTLAFLFAAAVLLSFSLGIAFDVIVLGAVGCSP